MASMIKDKIFPDCPIRNILARICDKWSMLIIYTLNAHADEPLRFNALRKLIPDISQKNAYQHIANARGRWLCSQSSLCRGSAQSGIFANRSLVHLNPHHRRAHWLGCQQHGSHHERSGKKCKMSCTINLFLGEFLCQRGSFLTNHANSYIYNV